VRTTLGLTALATTTPGTGVAAALAINVGSAGAPVLFNGALGTPSSGTLTNCTFPTLNQNTTGSAATLTTSRNFSISGGGITAAAVGFNGSAAVVLNASVDAGHITLARMADVATGTVFYRKTAGTGAPEVQTLATLKTDLAFGTAANQNTGTSGANVPLLNAANTWSADQSAAGYKITANQFSVPGGTVGAGILLGSRFGANASQILNNSNDLWFYYDGAAASALTITGLNSVFGGTISATNLSGTNTGDQTSIVGITGTLAQFNTAITDADIPLVLNVHYNANGAAQGSAIADYFTSALSLEAASTYEITCHAYFLKTTAGTVIWTWNFSNAPTAASSRNPSTPITGVTTSTITGAEVFSEATAQAVAAMAHAVSGSLTTAVYHSFMFTLLVRTNLATTLQLRSTQSAGTLTPQAGSYMSARKIV
jgi:hypothetical protein